MPELGKRKKKQFLNHNNGKMTLNMRRIEGCSVNAQNSFTLALLWIWKRELECSACVQIIDASAISYSNCFSSIDFLKV